jgi:hypothetical protein
MKTLMLSSIALCTVACASPSVRHEETIAPENNDPFSEQSSVRSRFLLQLRQLATEGDLFDTNSVARILDMRLHADTEMLKHTVRECGDGSMRWSEATNVTASDPTWYRALPSGAGHLDIPAFTCVTPASITREIPEARFSPGTDGVSVVIVEGRIDDDAAVRLHFVFRFGVTCALGAEVSQDQEDGLRYQRAVAKYKACRLPLDREFCATHPGFTWSNRELHREMVLNAYRRCGLINDFYIKESRSGEAAPLEAEEPPRFGQSPCESL